MILASIMVMSLLALILGVGLSFAHSKLKIAQDPGLKEIIEALPGVNCGVCGFASCRQFAQKLHGREVSIHSCKITSRNKELVERINALLDNTASRTL